MFVRIQKRPRPSVVLLIATLVATPALHAINEDMIRLQARVQVLQETVSRLQHSIDENAGILSDMCNRNAEKAAELGRALQVLQDRSQQLPNLLQEARFADMALRIELLQSAFDSFANRLEAVVQARSTLQPPTHATPSVEATTGELQLKSQAKDSNSTSPAAQSPNPDPSRSMELYQRALQHYGSKDFELAAGEFSEYLKTDRSSDNAINAQFYLAEMEYEEKDFEGALEDYTAISMRLGDQVRAARVQYKKALCLVEVDREAEAILELRALTERYPHSQEAALAIRKLRSLGAGRAIRP